MTALALLRIRIKTLAAEGSAHRKEETRSRCFVYYDPEDGEEAWYYERFYPQELRRELYLCRVNDIGVEQRASLLAYGFLRGRSYSQIEADPRWRREQPDKRGPDWTRVAALAFYYWPIDRFEKLPFSQGSVLDMLVKWRDNRFILENDSILLTEDSAVLPKPVLSTATQELLPARPPALAPR